jgi:putative transposase
MPDYRRNRVPGGSFFFALNLLDRRSDLLVTQIDILRDAVRGVRARADFPGRWRAIKIAFMKCLPAGEPRSPVMTSRGERAFGSVGMGAHDTRRAGFSGSHGLHAFQPGETRSRRAPGGLAAFIIVPVRRRWAAS